MPAKAVSIPPQPQNSGERLKRALSRGSSIADVHSVCGVHTPTRTCETTKLTSHRSPSEQSTAVDSQSRRQRSHASLREAAHRYPNPQLSTSPSPQRAPGAVSPDGTHRFTPSPAGTHRDTSGSQQVTPSGTQRPAPTSAQPPPGDGDGVSLSTGSIPAGSTRKSIPDTDVKPASSAQLESARDSAPMPTATAARRPRPRISVNTRRIHRRS